MSNKKHEELQAALIRLTQIVEQIKEAQAQTQKALAGTVAAMTSLKRKVNKRTSATDDERQTNSG